MKKDNTPKKQQIIVTVGSILSTAVHPTLRQMPLSLDNELPSTVLRFGTSDANEAAFTCHLDSCAAINIGNSLLHMWIMTEYPEILHSYKRYDDDSPFQPITLDYAVPSSAAKKGSCNLSVVVIYKQDMLISLERWSH